MAEQKRKEEKDSKVEGVVKNYGKRLFGFIRPRVNNEEDAEDILQEVYYELSNTLSLMQPIEQLASWLFTVARNRITDLYRKKKPATFSALDVEDDETLSEFAELLASDADSPEDDYLSSIIREELAKALNELPPNQKQVFELHEIQGISFKEISETTGVPVNTLLSRKRYAVIHLREKLRALYEDIMKT